MPTSPFEVDRQRGMPSAGIALSIKPTVLLCRCLTEHSPAHGRVLLALTCRHVSKREDFDMFIGTCNCDPRTLSMSRRGLLCAGGAGFVTALIGTLAGSSRTARAQVLASKPPEVDSVAVRIVTDNQIIKWIPTEKRDGLTIERRPGGNLSPDAPPSVDLVAEWGLSMHAESRRGNEVRNILVDFGYQKQTLLNNMSVLKIDPARFDALVLSHGHYDHFGGLVGFLSANQGRLKKDLPFFVGGEDCFCMRQTAAGQYGALDRKASWTRTFRS
jgi:7,8-dihydropterin-6-yl-methyl-4-(beta-D-ribofuranosyl)aminobenzene 5'-phosphate synthase